MARCPVCDLRAAIRHYLPWLAVACDQCGAFRITTAAAGVVCVYGATKRRKVSSRIRRASTGRRKRFSIDLEMLEALLHDETAWAGPPLSLTPTPAGGLYSLSSRQMWGAIMPWRSSVWYPFDKGTVNGRAPNSPGVYALKGSDGRWLFVGEAKCIAFSLLGHLASDDRRVTDCRPATFSFQCHSGVARRDALVRELLPLCTRAGSAESPGT